MKLSITTLLPALALASASPIERETYPIHAPRHLFTRQDVQTPINASLPNVTIFATGGTIASQGSSNTQTVGYSIGLGVEALIDAVPETRLIVPDDQAWLEAERDKLQAEGARLLKEKQELEKQLAEARAKDKQQQAEIATLQKKRDLYVFSAGSVFRRGFEGDVFDVNATPGAHSVYRYARSLWMEV